MIHSCTTMRLPYIVLSISLFGTGKAWENGKKSLDKIFYTIYSKNEANPILIVLHSTNIRRLLISFALLNKVNDCKHLCLKMLGYIFKKNLRFDSHPRPVHRLPSSGQIPELGRHLRPIFNF